MNGIVYPNPPARLPEPLSWRQQMALQCFRDELRRAQRRRRALGVDIGQRNDPTALALIEYSEEVGDLDYVTYQHEKKHKFALRFLERMPLGTSFVEIVEHVRTVALEFNSDDRPIVVVDATGVGAPIAELLTQRKFGSTIYPVIVTGGSAERSENGLYFAPKRNLITDVQILLEQRMLKIGAELPDAVTLMKEMKDMRVKVNACGHEQCGSWREGTHDDLVFAVALACWGMRRLGCR